MKNKNEIIPFLMIMTVEEPVFFTMYDYVFISTKGGELHSLEVKYKFSNHLVSNKKERSTLIFKQSTLNLIKKK